MSTLIRIANRAETDTGKSHTVERFQTRTTEAPAEVIASQLEALETIASACQAGMSLDEIQIELVSPVIEEGVVGDLAWMAIRQVMVAATAKLRRDAEATRFATGIGRS